MGNWRTWHMMERSDGSVSLYYTLPDDPAQHVVYDTLDGPRMSLLARAEVAEAECERLRFDLIASGAYEKEIEAENERLREQVAKLTAVIGDLGAMRRNFNAGWDRVVANTRQDAS